MSLYPILQPIVEDGSVTLPLCREVAWDYEHNRPIWRGGSPVLVTGLEAVKVWAHKALQVPRYQHEIYSWDYGNECDELIGAGYTDELVKAEAARYVKECLTVNPYIDEVKDISVKFDGDHLVINCKIVTIYGEVALHV